MKEGENKRERTREREDGGRPWRDIIHILVEDDAKGFKILELTNVVLRVCVWSRTAIARVEV